jgi:hypothetical protein
MSIKKDYSCYKKPQDDQGAHGDNSGTNNQASKNNQAGAASSKQLYRQICSNDPVAAALNGGTFR